MKNNPFELLIKQHEESKKLFEKLEKADDFKDQKNITEEIGKLIALHSAIEEQYLYPNLESLKETHDKIMESYEEHKQAEEELMKLRDIKPDTDDFTAVSTVLKEDLLHHMDEEEKELFPLAEKILPEEICVKIYENMQDTLKEEK